jgi:hypothetical protein
MEGIGMSWRRLMSAELPALDQRQRLARVSSKVIPKVIFTKSLKTSMTKRLLPIKSASRLIELSQRALNHQAEVVELEISETNFKICGTATRPHCLVGRGLQVLT